MAENELLKSPFKHAKADDSAGFLLWKTTALWQKKLAIVLAEFGITQTQFTILASLKWFEQQGEPTTQTHLVDHTKTDKMTLSKAIRKLENAGFVLRAPSPTDSRAVNILFTERGKTMVGKAIVAIENADDEFFSSLTNEQLVAYKTVMISLIQNN
jgi:DNA-binding MarR family transcriptional regulator